MLTSAYILRYRTGFSISSRSHTLELKWETNRPDLGAGGIVVAKPKKTSPNRQRSHPTLSRSTTWVLK